MTIGMKAVAFRRAPWNMQSKEGRSQIPNDWNRALGHIMPDSGSLLGHV